MKIALEAAGIRKVYPGTPPVVPVAGIDLRVADGESVAVGVNVCKIPPRSPRANAHAEGFVLTVRSASPTACSSSANDIHAKHLANSPSTRLRTIPGHRLRARNVSVAPVSPG